MEIVLFTGVAIVLYLVSDRLLLFFEKLYGNVLPYRSIIFFLIIMALAAIVFPIMENTMGPGENGGIPENPYAESTTTNSP